MTAGASPARPALLILPGPVPPGAAWTPTGLATGFARLGFVTVTPAAGPAGQPLDEAAARALVRWLRPMPASWGLMAEPWRASVGAAAAAWRSSSRPARARPQDASSGEQPPAGRPLLLRLHQPRRPGAAPWPRPGPASWGRGARAGRSAAPTADVATASGAAFLVSGKGDGPAMAAAHAALQPALQTRGVSVTPFEADAGPAFPPDRDYWKGSLDQGIEFLFKQAPPPPVP